MKVFDCITYFDEPMLFELRLNILNQYVDEFIVCESIYTHSGEKKKINFNKNNYPQFKDRITHLVVNKEPEGLIKIDKNSKSDNFVLRLNAIKRIEYQRNKIKKLLELKSPEDLIIYSDSDEIPNLSVLDLKKIKNKIILFKQKVFYYKFNLFLESQDWFGSKACKIKDLKSISGLRNIKNKKYPWWRIDTFFKKNKYTNLQIIDNGGWHFSMLKKPQDIYFKQKNDEHHDEFDLIDIKVSDIEEMVKSKYIIYDHSIDKGDLNKKWSKNNRVYLSKIDDKSLPDYLIINKTKYKDWFD